MLSIILMTLLVCGLSTNAWAQYYKYVDKNGTVCFTDNPTAPEVRGVIEKKGIDVIKNRTMGNRQLTREEMLIYSTEKPGSAEVAQQQRKIREAQEEALHQREKAQKQQAMREKLAKQKAMREMREMREMLEKETEESNRLKNKSNTVNRGAIDVGTGQFYPGTAGGIINPNTGEFMPDVGSGYIRTSTGEFLPKINR